MNIYIYIGLLFINLLLSSSIKFDDSDKVYRLLNMQDSLNVDLTGDINQLPTFSKSPGKALLFSGILPGSGQFYMEQWFRGLIFIALDGIAIGTWNYNNNRAENKKEEYKKYALDHWDLERWIHDYYKWYPELAPNDFSGNQEDWKLIREVFVNKSDTLSGCHEPPYCYVDIWDNSHHVEFSYEGNIISSNSEKFKDAFEHLCGNTINPSNPTCLNNDLDMLDPNGDTIVVRTGHHFFEGIQKYDMFFAGWEDNDTAKVVIKSNNERIVTSEKQTNYQNLWIDYNNIKTFAANGGKFMLINRVVSMIDAILLAQKWNTKHDVKLSLNAYPDIKNKTGLGGLKLSLYFN